LVDAQPAVTAFQSDLADTHNSIGVVLVSTGKPAEALEEFRKAAAIVQKLVDAEPGNPFWKAVLAWLHNNIGRALGRQKRLAEAFTVLDAGLAAHQQLAESDPTNILYSRALGWSHGHRGGTRVRAGQPAEAAADLRKALELWAKIQQPDSETQVERARALANLAGLGADAKSGVTAAEAKAFADQSVTALAAIVKTGWALPSELREPDFDALRGRADFQTLVVVVEAKAEKAPETAAPREKR
jgi:tetratricopeptide (TPR) repeat protein